MELIVYRKHPVYTHLREQHKRNNAKKQYYESLLNNVTVQDQLYRNDFLIHDGLFLTEKKRIVETYYYRRNLRGAYEITMTLKKCKKQNYCFYCDCHYYKDHNDTYYHHIYRTLFIDEFHQNVNLPRSLCIFILDFLYI